MKTKKTSLKLQGLAIALTLCAIMVFFTGSSAYARQADVTKTINRAEVMVELLAKFEALEKKIELMNQRLIIIETKLVDRFNKIDATLSNKGIGLDPNLINQLSRMETAIIRVEKDMARILKK
jgi:hypothetical protein